MRRGSSLKAGHDGCGQRILSNTVGTCPPRNRRGSPTQHVTVPKPTEPSAAWVSVRQQTSRTSWSVSLIPVLSVVAAVDPTIYTTTLLFLRSARSRLSEIGAAYSGGVNRQAVL